MSKNRELKEQRVAELTQQLGGAAATVFADFRGLSVAEDTELRRQLRTAGVTYHVVKNNLLRRAAEAAGIEGLNDILVGPTAVAYSDDTVAPARELHNFAKDHEQLEIKAGVLEGKVVSLEAVKALATLPPREVLLAKLLGGLQAPLTGMATVLSAPLRGFATAAQALQEQKAAAEAS